MIFNPELPFKEGCVMKVDGTTGEPYYAAAKNLPFRMLCITYVGTGTYGQNAPVEVHLPFKPILLLFPGTSQRNLSLAFYGDTSCYQLDSLNSVYCPTHMTWSGNKLSWWDSGSAASNCNSQGVEYKIWVVG